MDTTTALDPGVYFQQVRPFATPMNWLEGGMIVRLPDCKKIRITMHNFPNAVMYTLDRDNRPTKVDSYDFLSPWRMPYNRVFVAQRKNLAQEVSLMTVSAIEQNGMFWLICEERIINVFIDESGYWSSQLWGKDGELTFLVHSFIISPETLDRKDFRHPELQIGQIAFWHYASGTGAICIGRKDDGSAILARIFWGNVPARKELEGLRGFKPGEIVHVLLTVPLKAADTRFAREVVEIEF